MNVPIEKSVPLQENYPSVLERYFKPRYIEKSGNDICLLFHSNKICLVTLAKTHEIFKQNLPIKEVNFQISDKLNRASNKVSGKAKRGGQHLNEKSVLCKIELTDGTCYNIEAGVKGKLIEINEHLIANPNIIREKPETDGYIAVILQKLGTNNSSSDQLSVKKELV